MHDIVINLSYLHLFALLHKNFYTEQSCPLPASMALRHKIKYRLPGGIYITLIAQLIKASNVIMVGSRGFEPLTSSTSRKRSSQLS